MSVEHGLERLSIQLKGPSADRYHNLAFSDDGKVCVACMCMFVCARVHVSVSFQ